MTNDPGAAAVDAYLSETTDAERAALQHVRELVLTLVPQATERVAYGIPIISHDGDLVGFGAAKRHLSLHVMSTALVSEMQQELEGFANSGATVRFNPENPLPDELVTRIVAARLNENAATRAARAAARAAKQRRS